MIWRSINNVPDSLRYVLVWIAFVERITDSDGFEHIIKGHWEKGFYDPEHDHWYNESGNSFKGTPTRWLDVKPPE